MTTRDIVSGRMLRKELLVRVPPERAFRAFTDTAELERWFVASADIVLAPGGLFNLTWSNGEFVPGTVVEVQPPHRFVFDWDDGPQYGVTRITVEFSSTDDGSGTHIVLTHTGFGHEAAWDALYHDVDGGWTMELEHLRAWLEQGSAKTHATSADEVLG